MAIGRIYDTSETDRLSSILNKQEQEFQAIDTEKAITDKKTLQYALILAGAVVLLVGFKFLIKK